jgi:hypothetical protein
MLQGVKPERGVEAGFVITVNSKYTAFFARFVIVMIEQDHMRP